ncbi:hypothetical protein [Halocatena salina]|uniref:Uncharacterized protein n=1 Tax=Halocatena salina TaxID=2934340 RepID=A0A8U0A7G8_9EURY|nr:hypothetical protein [Halocatena salina]UPM45130.1 hypothetical protein MW046_17375 [Halocatena salina]
MDVPNEFEIDGSVCYNGRFRQSRGRSGMVKAIDMNGGTVVILARTSIV